MQHDGLFESFADLVLILHFSIVVFVVAGLILIVAGNMLGWRWVNLLWYRASHLAAICYVAAESWMGITCPLTTLESWLRTRAGEAPYDRGFIEYWLQRAIFFDAPAWVFTLAYTLFGVLVVLVWWYYPPERKK
jgi:hypothetical protein